VLQRHSSYRALHVADVEDMIKQQVRRPAHTLLFLSLPTALCLTTCRAGGSARSGAARTGTCPPHPSAATPALLPLFLFQHPQADSDHGEGDEDGEGKGRASAARPALQRATSIRLLVPQDKGVKVLKG
jgi:hypothetical protein